MCSHGKRGLKTPGTRSATEPTQQDHTAWENNQQTQCLAAPGLRIPSGQRRLRRQALSVLSSILRAAALGRSGSFRGGRDRSLTFLALLAEPHGLGKLGTSLGVVWGDHRVIGGEIPLSAVLLGRHVIGRAEMTLERLK
jgi:hypothetical protein